jgi:H+/Na+-translocating ferredoxin:NAD+ oxidoreductase subunit B
MIVALKGLLVLGSVGFIFAVLLAYLSKKLYVAENPLVGQIMEALPGINCGACGYSGCKAYAEAIAAGNELVFCKPGGLDVNDKVAGLLNKTAGSAAAQKVIIRCGSDKTQKKMSYDYTGPQSCLYANQLGGGIDCQYGCLGLGDCTGVCPTQALVLKDRKITVVRDKCIGCGKCVTICPRSLFKLVSTHEAGTTYVACSNKDKGAQARKVCQVSCIGCGICVRMEGSSFVLNNNLSEVDYDKPVLLEAINTAKEKCPTHCILKYDD